MNLNITFRNKEQEAHFFSKARDNRFGGGFGNGKTYSSCQRALSHLMLFPGYRVAFCRQVYKNLRSTTMQTFFKMCPADFILRHDEQFGITVFLNGSVAFWLHLDQMDEATAKGFEINALIIDQAEEVEESIYLLMDSRVGRWDMAKVPQYLQDAAIAAGQKWPTHPKWGHALVPNYVDILDNPSDDDFHWTGRFFDDDSPEKIVGSFNIVRQTDDDLNDPKTIAKILGRDPAWVDKYYRGLKVKSGAMIHTVPKECLIKPKDYTKDVFDALIEKIRKKASLYRTLDHGDAAPTVVGYEACYNGVHLVFGEYYVPNEIISVHRRNIFDISIELAGEANQDSFLDYADPSIFKQSTQKGGIKWTTAQEYSDVEEIIAPPFFWSPADNNEMATRNRINELLRPSLKFTHPITGISPSPGIFFILSDIDWWPHGVHNILFETQKQRKQLLGEINGKKFYSDERDESISDHGYDVLRYYVAIHGSGVPDIKRTPPKRSFANYNRIYKLRKMQISQESEAS